MIISYIKIENFRGIQFSEIFLHGHTLLLGANNIGKSTICEAIDLTIGPDRLSRQDPIDEYDFFNGQYLNQESEPIEISIELVLTRLNTEQQSIFASYLNFWNKSTSSILGSEEIDTVDEEQNEVCLHLKFIGVYNPEEDEFEAKTYFANSLQTDGTLREVTKSQKRNIGFLYLRALRTGRRALSLERGTLLDIILKVSATQVQFWEDTRNTLLQLPLDEKIGDLRFVLDDLEKRISEYIPLNKKSKNTSLQVSQLTRVHLRKTLSFFMASLNGTSQIPFERLGTGTLSTLVFSMLSTLAELKKENVIFAMEEPEIAVAPHTQRRIIQYLLSSTSQSIVTSHSPYVIEMFEAKQVLLLQKDEHSKTNARRLELNNKFLKAKTYRSKLRHSLAEAVLGCGVILGEGITEREVLFSASKIMETSSDEFYPLDLSGISIIDSDGDGNLIRYGNFFKSIGLPVYGFFDKQNLSTEKRAELVGAFDFYSELSVKKIEDMLISEVPISIQWQFITDIKNSVVLTSGPSIPDEQPSDSEIQDLTRIILVQAKGDRRSARLIEFCTFETLPATVSDFLIQVYSCHPRKELLEDEAQSHDEKE